MRRCACLLLSVLFQQTAALWPWAPVQEPVGPAVELPDIPWEQFEHKLTQNVGRMSDSLPAENSWPFRWFRRSSVNESRSGDKPGDKPVVGTSDQQTSPSMDVAWNLNDVGVAGVSGEFGTLTAFADFDSDKHADLVSISKNSDHDEPGSLAISVRLWDPNSHMFGTPINFPLPKFVNEVLGLIPADVDLDGSVDFIVMFPSLSEKVEFLFMKQLPTLKQLVPSWSTQESTRQFHSHVQFSVVDVNFDGFPDLLGQMRAEDVPTQFERSGGRFIWVNQRGESFLPEYFGSEEIGPFLKWDSKTLPSLSQPHSSAFLDLNGDCVPDLVLDVTDSAGERYLEVWLAHLMSQKPGVSQKTGPGVSRKPGSGVKDSTDDRFLFPINHVSQRALIDLNIFGVLSPSSKDGSSSSPSVGLQPVYVHSRKHRLNIPKGAQQLSFADVTSDGTIDVVVPFCESFDSRSHTCIEGDEVIVYSNEQPPICKELSFETVANCRPVRHLCQSQEFSWDSKGQRSSLNPVQSIKKLNGRHFFGTNMFPITLRIGDFDSDGFPDLLTLVKGPEGESQIMLLRNNLGHPTTEKKSLGASILSIFSMTGVELNSTDMPSFFSPFKILSVSGFSLDAATFFDIGEDGRLDALALGSAESRWWNAVSGSPPLELISFLQSESDSLFIKASGLSGACGASCPNDTLTYGSHQYGATFKFSGTDLDGSRFARSSSQLAQSAYSPFQLPFALMGLGVVNNYIDYFYYGISYTSPPAPTNSTQEPSTDSGKFHRWISLIPNSCVIANPHPRDDPTQWTLELSVSPSRYFWRILFATVISLVVIGLVICILDRKEKMEDLKEAQGFKRHFIAVG